MANLNSISFSLKLVLLFIIFPLSTNAASFSVLRYGAKPNGRTDSTKAFSRAWSLACQSRKPATMWIPKGTYLVKKVTFNGPCRSKRVTVQFDGKIVAPPKNIWVIGSSRNWILFHGINGLTITGGVIDARGSQYWNCRRSGGRCPQGAVSLSIDNVKNGVISGLTSINSQQSHISINGCNKMLIQRVTIIAPRQSPNTDGIHLQASTSVTIIDSTIGTGDDCIAIGPGTKKLLVQRVKCGPGHGISIGSLARSQNEAGVQGIVVKDVTFDGSDNGVRIKTWARPSNGFVKNVLYQNIVMKSVRHPIIIDQTYCPGDNGCPNQNSGIKISGVTYLNVHGTSRSPIAVSLHCSRTTPCTGIKLYNVKLSYSKKPAKSFCYSAAGTSRGQVLPGSCF